MKKQLNVDAIMNELRGESSFFKRPSDDAPLPVSNPAPAKVADSKDTDQIQSTKTTKKKTQSPKTKKPSSLSSSPKTSKKKIAKPSQTATTVSNPTVRTVQNDVVSTQAKRVGFTPPPELDGRITRRHPFEIYSDQLDSLRLLKEQKFDRGEKTSLSEMVREALDAYLESEITTENE